jgi:hypothetical protein
MASRIRSSVRRLSRGLRGLERRMGLRPELELKTVLPEDEFERELGRQSLFAERTGAQCLLLRFFLSSGFPGEREEAMECLMESVRARMRLSDVAGRWADPEDSVALILRGARPEGAALVRSAVADGFEGKVRRVCPGVDSGQFLCTEIRSFPLVRERQGG